MMRFGMALGSIDFGLSLPDQMSAICGVCAHWRAELLVEPKLCEELYKEDSRMEMRRIAVDREELLSPLKSLAAGSATASSSSLAYCHGHMVKVENLTNESHVAVTRRSVDGHALIHQTLAQGINVINQIGQMTKVTTL